MKRTSILLALGLLGVFSTAAMGQNVARYAWEFPAVTDVSKDAEPLKAELVEQVADILKSGHLTPWRVSHADQSLTSYFVYLEPGRIITTLAWAYPHLPAEQQAAAKKYVAAEFASPVFAPYAANRIPADVKATRREFHPLTKVWNWSTGWQDTRPTVQTLYGAWLWAYRADDWQTVQKYWPQLKKTYAGKARQANTYGTMGAHIGIARLAERFGDTATRDQALANLTALLKVGRNFDAIETNAKALYKQMYHMATRKRHGTHYLGWMFMDATPEIGRYLAENVRQATLERHEAGKERFPLWWLMDAPYFQRDYTGDEGVGLVTPEMFGMIYPIERWVVGADAKTLAGYMRSGPSCHGDCAWIEALVQTIEAFGQTTWTDVRE